MIDCHASGSKDLGMNKIVKRHYPVANLPEELRKGLPDDALVSVTVETETPKREPKSELLLELERVRKTLPEFVTVEDAVDRIRGLRSEWDD